jgi:hypothetical protein
MLHDTIRRRAEIITHDAESLPDGFTKDYIIGGVNFAMERMGNAQSLELRRDAAKAKRLNAEAAILQSRIDAAYEHVNRLLEEAENELKQALMRQM